MNQDMVKAQFNMQFLEMDELTTEEIEKLGHLSKLSPLDIKRIVDEKRLRELGMGNGKASPGSNTNDKSY